MSAAAPFGPEDFARETGVSRETLAHLKIFAEILRDWNARHNLVSARSLDDLWRRHMWDSAQLVPLIPSDAASLVDLGSGAGFPGLILAALLRGRIAVSLYEATRKKADFLESAAKRMDLTVVVRNMRAEDDRPQPTDVVTARAVAPLPLLLGYAQQFCAGHTVCLFLKGQSVAAELTEARKSWRMKVSQHQSATDPSGVILEIRELGHVGKSGRKRH